MAKTIEDYLQAKSQWGDLIAPLRRLLLETGLEETIKWGAPVYCQDNKNLIGLAAFQGYAGLWFFQGCFLSDPAGVLTNAQPGKTRGMRQWRFAAGEEVNTALVKQYIQEAVSLHRQRKAVSPQRREPVILAAELTAALERNPQLKSAFESLTPGRQSEYSDYIQAARREATRIARLQKITPLILAGQGLNDQYRGPC
ncbi:YdeI/OmpD-associated family protein [Bowmanella dokdonensis]|uniref:YdeI/OmpD-associated family protein n=1 Tax=Bowmanella dokdonensis TaxID=751969 RepID=A0A939IMJ9_9ALTE|nr:DUF1801 domain-containing protein [Bowmanella dokdonensis]MBN7823875.1 YdeI/OmpD-associated family protein [Bowmanella dokdonensis]